MVERVTFESPETGPNAPTPEAPAPAPIPDNLPDNVKKSMTDMRAEVTRLQQELAKHTKPAEQSQQPTPPQEAPKPEDKPAEQPKPEGQDDAAKKVTEAAGFDVATYQTEYDTSGDVSPESRERIAEGLKSVLGPNARQIVDDFIESKKVVHQNDRKLYMDAAGGDEAYTTMTAWAAQNLPKEQVEAYNRQVNSGDRASTLFAIEGLRAKFEAANGRSPTLFKGTSAPPAGGIQPFRSTAEMVRAMSSEQYKTDPAYRDDVQKRLAVSSF